MSWIRNVQQVKQAIDFTGTGGKVMHPTDVDALFEFDNKYLILFEVKRWGNKMDTGQVLALSRIVNAWEKDGKTAILILCWHRQLNTNKPIQLNKCKVAQVYHKGQLKDLEVQINVLKYLRKFANKYDIHKLKNIL